MPIKKYNPAVVSDTQCSAFPCDDGIFVMAEDHFSITKAKDGQIQNLRKSEVEHLATIIRLRLELDETMKSLRLEKESSAAGHNTVKALIADNSSLRVEVKVLQTCFDCIAEQRDAITEEAEALRFDLDWEKCDRTSLVRALKAEGRSLDEIKRMARP